MRVLFHVQHLSGVGHLVRADQIARALAEAHDVRITDGGRPVPRPAAGGRLRRLGLPPIARGPDGLRACEPGRDVAAVMAERGERLRRAVTQGAPDVVLVEHFPFGKWELHGEITELVAAARAANPAVAVICSLRDIWTERRHAGAGAGAHGARVLSLLEEHFDALLVHTDPAFTRLEDHFPEVASLSLPVRATGIVSEAWMPASASGRPPGAPIPSGAKVGAGAGGRAEARGRVVLSVGGGAGGGEVELRCIDAWRRLAGRGAVGERVLDVFPGLFTTEAERSDLRAATADGPFELHAFGLGFLPALAAADLSISRAGYNTCANLLQTRCRAVLLPDPRMADQRRRAERFARHGLAAVLEDGEADAERLADAVVAALARPRPSHGFDLGGARRTRELIEDLVRPAAAEGRPSLREER